MGGSLNETKKIELSVKEVKFLPKLSFRSCQKLAAYLNLGSVEAVLEFGLKHWVSSFTREREQYPNNNRDDECKLLWIHLLFTVDFGWAWKGN